MWMWGLLLALLAFLSLPPVALSSLTLSLSDQLLRESNEILEFPLYNDIAWTGGFAVTNVTLIDITVDRSLFDYCDLSQYTRDNVQGVLAHHNYHQGEGESEGRGRGWVAFMRGIDLVAGCPSTQSWTESYQKTWKSILAGNVQDLGAIGLIYHYQGIKGVNLVKRLALPYMDLQRHTIFGKEIGIFCAYIPQSKDLSKMMDLFGESYQLNISLTVEARETPNPLDGALSSSSSLFRILSYIFSAGSSFSILDACRVLLGHYRANQNSLPLNYGSFSLVLIMFTNIVRLVASFDLGGFQGLYPSLSARVLYSMGNQLALCSLLGTYFNWINVTATLNNSLNSVLVKPGVKGRRRLLVASIVFVAVDIAVSIVGYFGRLPGNTVIMTANIALSTNTICAITGFINFISNAEALSVKVEDHLTSLEFRAASRKGNTKGHDNGHADNTTNNIGGNKEGKQATTTTAKTANAPAPSNYE